MNVKHITIEVCDTKHKQYDGFTYKLSKNIIQQLSDDDIIMYTKDYMKNFLNNNNLYYLKKGINLLEFEINRSFLDNGFLFLHVL